MSDLPVIVHIERDLQAARDEFTWALLTHPDDARWVGTHGRVRYVDHAEEYWPQDTFAAGTVGRRIERFDVGSGVRPSETIVAAIRAAVATQRDEP